MQYLRNDRTWTHRSDMAADFSTAYDAVATKTHYQLSQVEIVLQMLDAPNPRYDLIVPLS